MISDLFGSRLRAGLIGWLFTHADERFFVRRLAGILGENSTNVSRELARLAGLGILTATQDGRQKYYQADPRCAIFDELRSIAAKTAGAGDDLRRALAPLAAKIRVAFIYGSVADGRANARSDVDVLVVGEASFEEVVDALREAQDRLRRDVNPTVYTPREFAAKLRSGHHFVGAVLASPKIFLAGDERELERMA